MTDEEKIQSAEQLFYFLNIRGYSEAPEPGTVFGDYDNGILQVDLILDDVVEIPETYPSRS